MRNLYNIERSGFRPGVYVGYATWRGVSVVYTFRKVRKEWRGRCAEPGAPELIGRTLASLSASLDDLAHTP